MGSKNRIAYQLIDIILKDRQPNQWYVEPFVGGANVIDKVEGRCLGSDLNKYLIAMWRGLQRDFPRPKKISFELYSQARNEYNNNTQIEMDDFLIGWIGWMASYNGRFFDGGYSGNYWARDYIGEQIRNVEKQIKFLKEVEFSSSSYEKLEYPKDSLIYCDIPYKGSKQYNVSKNFNYDNFWSWCRGMTQQGHKLFISEYEAPQDFECVYDIDFTRTIHQTNTYTTTEKLFTLKAQ